MNLDKFNPANATALTDEDIAELQHLTSDEIETLAKAYPARLNEKPYLMLHNKELADNMQMFPVSTFPALHSLRKLGKDNFSIFNFEVNRKKVKGNTPFKAVERVSDLTAEELQTLEGLKGAKLDDKEISAIKELSKEQFNPLMKAAVEKANSEKSNTEKIADDLKNGTFNTNTELTADEIKDKKIAELREELEKQTVANASQKVLTGIQKQIDELTK